MLWRWGGGGWVLLGRLAGGGVGGGGSLSVWGWGRGGGGKGRKRDTKSRPENAITRKKVEKKRKGRIRGET